MALGEILLKNAGSIYLFIYLFTMFTEDCPVSNITILSRGPPLKCIKDKNIDYIQNVYT